MDLPKFKKNHLTFLLDLELILFQLTILKIKPFPIPGIKNEISYNALLFFSFTRRIDLIITKAHTIFGFIIRNTQSISSATIVFVLFILHFVDLFWTFQFEYSIYILPRTTLELSRFKTNLFFVCFCHTYIMLNVLYHNYKHLSSILNISSFPQTIKFKLILTFVWHLKLFYGRPRLIRSSSIKYIVLSETNIVFNLQVEQYNLLNTYSKNQRAIFKYYTLVNLCIIMFILLSFCVILISFHHCII